MVDYILKGGGTFNEIVKCLLLNKWNEVKFKIGK